ncbi:putative DD34D transposase [Trichonephila clavipes]|nr:putative DD34D transposase [Trichonephila clavipes]
MDETWLHHFTPESSQQLAEWTARDEPTPKRGKTQKFASKVMASVFWDTHDEIAEKRPHLKKKKVLLHQDNAQCHKSMKSMTKLHELGFELLLHPPYTPDLAPSDFFLFSDLKRMLAGQKFRADGAEIEAYFEAKDKS